MEILEIKKKLIEIKIERSEDKIANVKKVKLEENESRKNNLNLIDEITKQERKM